MKRFLIALTVCVCMAFSAPAMALDHPLTSSGVLTADALVTTKAGFFAQVIIQPDGTNDCTVQIYNGQDATGTQILPTFVFAGDGGPQATPPVIIRTPDGIYVDITLGAGTVSYTVLYGK